MSKDGAGGKWRWGFWLIDLESFKQPDKLSSLYYEKGILAVLDMLPLEYTLAKAEIVHAPPVGFEAKHLRLITGS